MRAQTRHHSPLAALWTALVVFVVLALWQYLSSSGVWNASIVPPPSQAARALWEFRVTLLVDAGVTLAEIVIGFLMTVGLAILFSATLHLLPAFSRDLYAVLILLQCVPLWALAPLLFYWLGPGLLTRLVVVVLMAFFPVVVNTTDGLKQVDRDLTDVFRCIGASKWERFRKLEFPGALVMVLAGSKVTLTMCLIGAVLAEMLIGDMIGLGYRLREASAHFRVDLVFAAVALLSAIALALFALISVTASRLLPWLKFPKEM